jgi:hypothetical protein
VKTAGGRQAAAGRDAGPRVRRLPVFSAVCLLPAALCFPGCSSSKTESPDQKSEKALRDPFSYSPDIEKTDVSGGGWLDYDKEGMRKDLRNVLDP